MQPEVILYSTTTNGSDYGTLNSIIKLLKQTPAGHIRGTGALCDGGAVTLCHESRDRREEVLSDIL